MRVLQPTGTTALTIHSAIMIHKVDGDMGTGLSCLGFGGSELSRDGLTRGQTEGQPRRG